MIGQRRTGRALLAVGAMVITAGFGVGIGADPAVAAGGSHHQRAPQVVALGDSFSSGEGTFDYRADTDTTTNRCHRSDRAYGAVLARIAGSGRLVACSGALTRDITAPNHLFPGEPAQLDAVSRRTKLITLGIGGNDVGFSTILGACVQGARTPGGQCSKNPLVLGLVASGLAALGAAPDPNQDPTRTTVPISELLGDLAARAPRAKILLVGYPRLFGSDPDGYAADPTVPSGRSCALEPSGRAVFDSADAAWVNAATDRLNALLAGAARQADAAGLDVDFVAASTFAGHGLCDAKRPFINGLVLTADGFAGESLHPTARGQLAYLEAVLRTLGRRVCGERVSARQLTTLGSSS